MARPKSEDKRNAILAAATAVFAEQGLGAPTARIAKVAGVAEGTLFNYFDTKDQLLNQLYVHLKGDLRDVMLPGFPAGQSAERGARHAWQTYVNWGVAHPASRKVMNLLNMSERINELSRIAGMESFVTINALLEDAIASGPLRDQPPAFCVAIMGALAETTMDFISREPDKAEQYGNAGFKAFWNAIGKS